MFKELKSAKAWGRRVTSALLRGIYFFNFDKILFLGKCIEKNQNSCNLPENDWRKGLCWSFVVYPQDFSASI